jgi:predicted lipoprotein with Yx(FWY)xxD motif
MYARIPRGAPWVATACVALLAAAHFYGSPQQDPGTLVRSPVPIATPLGITLQMRNIGKRARVATLPQWVYADSDGMSLYTYDRDTARGSPACGGACAAAWPAALAPPTAAPSTTRPDADWTQLKRTDGTRQWRFRGALLYGFAKEKAIGDTAGDGAEDGAWHVAVFRPDAGMVLPDGIAVREIADAGGAGLVDSLGMTLYTFDGNATHPKPLCGAGDCARVWTALEAPEIAGAVGEFSVITRADGISQWAYRGKPLYKYDADQQPSEVNGSGVDGRFHVALVVRFFMPNDATLSRTLELGNILTTRDGATLYQRDRVAGGAELHPFRTDHGSPALGRSFGTSTCDANCAKTWPPFNAPQGALACGFWDIATRADGTRQWLYKGFALYTYAADSVGDFKGNGIYDLESIGGKDRRAASDNPSEGVDPAGTLSGVGVGAMFWHAVVP